MVGQPQERVQRLRQIILLSHGPPRHVTDWPLRFAWRHHESFAALKVHNDFPTGTSLPLNRGTKEQPVNAAIQQEVTEETEKRNPKTLFPGFLLLTSCFPPV
jgi:hypothetical protein